MAKSALRMAAGALCLAIAYLLLVPPAGRPPAVFPRHAVWLDRYWLRGTMSEPDMERELRHMAEASVRTLFVHAGPFEPDGTIPVYEPERVTMISRAAKRAASDMRVFAWLGGLNAAAGGDLDLMSQSVRGNAGESARRLVMDGFDGVHLNIEPTPSGDPGFLLLLADVRTCLPETATLSVATNLWGPRWLPNRMLFSNLRTALPAGFGCPDKGSAPGCGGSKPEGFGVDWGSRLPD